LAQVIDPSLEARSFRQAVKARVGTLGRPLTVVGFLTAEAGPSVTYANYTKVGCDDVGIRFDLRHVQRLELERAIDAANADPDVHGVFIYYPIFGGEHDRYVKDLVDPRKDVEGLNTYWVRKLYHNERFDDAARTRKAILPCTPLAIVKLLEAAGAVPQEARPKLGGRTVAVFNRSEVVGRPLASMLANDGARVVSFDVDGPMLFTPAGIEETRVTRAEALRQADIVVTGVPSRDFALVRADELKPGVVAVNFSTFKNFADDVEAKARVFVPRVGPMTVAMALRNALRLYESYHAGA
jgi:methylenetetrahydrofolate dehydrogenase (NADP+)/methenyltetrahydrofolate cyclohydrolase